MTDIEYSQGAKPVSFVTVVYRGELGLLRLQARSLARYMAVLDVCEVLVILNDVDPERLRGQIEQFRDEWGGHAPALRLVSPADIFQGPRSVTDWPKAMKFDLKTISRGLRLHSSKNWGRANGWLIQQALKLACARVAKGSQLVFLDAKNHFVGESTALDFFSEEGTARARLHAMEGESFDWHQSAYDFLKFPQLSRKTPLPPAITPYCATTKDVLETLTRIETAGGPIEYFFKPGTNKGSEFTLLAAVQMKNGTLAEDLIPFDTLFRGATEQQLHGMIERVQQGALRMIGSHSGMLKVSTPTQLLPLHQLWQSCGLVKDVNEALALTPYQVSV